jgi:multiple sugar transport system permease protein
MREQSIPTAPGVERGRSRVQWRKELARNTTAYLFLLPALVLFTTFLWWPIISAFIVSFQQIDLRHEPTWVGLDNFRRVLNDPLLGIAWRNTLYYTVLALIFGYIAPVVLAIAVNEMRWKSYFRFAFYLPGILPAIVTAALWRWVFDPGPGLANSLLQLIGLPALPWLQSPRTAMIGILVVTTWAGAGGTMIMYLAALQSIPAHLYDAAEIDGANMWQRIIHITIPQIRGVMLLFLIGQIIGTMQLFTEPFVMTDGGPNNATLTVMLLLYRYAFANFEFGQAGAMGVLLFLFLAGFSIWYLRMTFFKPKAE